MNLFFRILYFFIFFVSFCIINIPSLDWGLQVSCIIAILIFILYPFCKLGRFKIIWTYNFKLVTTNFLLILINTIISLLLIDKNILVFNEVEIIDIIGRSSTHIIYVVFEYIMFLYIYIYLYNSKNHILDLKYFITLPALFITLWGIYQWLTTFDIFPYIDIFNNSLSTKFTYLRFKADHRTASVFPEPSEYAYFLAFMMPFAFKAIRNGISLPYIVHQKIFSYLIFLSVILCQSMSLFCVIPLIIMYILRQYIRLTLKKIFTLSIISLFVISTILFIASDRVSVIISGDDGSAITRYDAFFETIDLFIKSPIIGVGFGAVRGLDLLSFLLGTTGIIGTISFFYMILKLRSYSKTNSLFIDGLRCMIIVALISNPIIDLTFFWPILAFISIPLNIENSHEKSNLRLSLI